MLCKNCNHPIEKSPGMYALWYRTDTHNVECPLSYAEPQEQKP